MEDTEKHKQKKKPFAKTAILNLLKETSSSTINENAVRKAMLPKTLGSKISKKQQLSRLLEESVNEDIKIQKSKKKNKRKRQKQKVELDEAPRLQRRSRYLLIKMKLEQNLIDAYSGEGWKGQSREKIKPEKELQRARKQILKCKLGIRDAIRQLESLGSVGSVEDSILCAKCKLQETFPDNDIISCDGTCYRAFHEKCLDLPMITVNVPSDHQGFLCNFCVCKMDIIEAMNAHLGTCFSVSNNWQDIFKEEAAFPDDGVVPSNTEADWPSDDSEDGDYDPEKNEYSKVDSEHSGSGDANTSGSLSWSFENEAFSGEVSEKETVGVSKNNCTNLNVSEDSDDNNELKIIYGRRKRRAVDYKMLYEEMFGKDENGNEHLSEDEEWGPSKRKRKGKESAAASTLMAICESEKNNAGVEPMEIKSNQPPDVERKRHIFRLPPNAVQKLRQVFAENELPSRSMKESLSKQLSLDSRKVNKWFKNARYAILKTRKAVTAKECQSSSPKISKKSSLEIANFETSDLMKSRDTSSATLIHTRKSLKKVHRRKNVKPLASAARKKQLRRAMLGSPSQSKKVIMELGDDMTLKNQMQLLKSKCTLDNKHVAFKSGADAQAAEMQMERLCRVMSQLENMKQMLSKFQSKRDSATSCSQDVMYFPIAELREKL